MTAQIVSEAEVDRSLWKILFLGILLIGASVLAVYTFNLTFLEAKPVFFFYAVLSSVLLLVLMILSTFFIKSYGWLGVIVLLAAAAPLALFYPQIDISLGAGAAFFFLLLMSASRRGHNSLANSLKVRFFMTAGTILPKAVTGLLIFLAVIFFSHYFDVKTGSFNERINRFLVKEAVIASEPAVRIFMPDFSANGSTDEALRLFVSEQIVKVVPDYEKYLPEVRERIFGETFSNFKKSLEQTIGPFDGKKSLTENLYNAVASRYLDNLSGNNKLIFAIIFTFALFLVIKGVVSFFHWLIEFFAFILFKILLVTNFAYLSLENRSREFVALT